jgi:hypothetical protein
MARDGTGVDDTAMSAFAARRVQALQLQRMWDSRVKTSHLQDWLAEDKEGLRRSEDREELKQGKHLGV